MESQGESIAHELLSKIRQTQEYRDYKKQKALLSNYPALKHSTDLVRMENFKIQQSDSVEQTYSDMKDLIKRNQELLKEPVVQDYLVAESIFCRMMQNIADEVIKGLDF